MSMNYSQYEELKTKLLELDARKKNLEKTSTKELENAKLKIDSVLPRVLHLTELIFLTGNEVITEGNDESGLNIFYSDNTYIYSIDDNGVTEDYTTSLRVNIGMGDYSTYGYRFEDPPFGASEAEKAHVSAVLADKFIMSFGRFEAKTLRRIKEYIPMEEKYLDKEEKKLRK